MARKKDKPLVGDELRQRAFWAMVNHAFFRWESAIVIALTIVLTGLDPLDGLSFWQPWYWVVFGFVAEALIFVSTLTDPEEGRKAVAAMLAQQFNPGAVKNRALSERIARALEYREGIEKTIRETRSGLLRSHLEGDARQVDEWLDHIYRLAQRLDNYYQDKVIKQDMHSVPLAIKNFKARLKMEDDPAVQAQMEQTIAQKEAQWQALQRLENTMEKAEFQLESTLTSLGTVYSQMRNVDAKDVDSGRAARLSQDISDQVAQLADIEAAMDEVYIQR
ncbi:MAG: hypothetical protein ACOYZ7_14630 [Chloroflexota bacterium]